MKKVKNQTDHPNKIQYYSHKTLWTHKSYYDTFGIYALAWPEQKVIYIGQSKYIARRLIGHINKIKDGYHDNDNIVSFYNSIKTRPRVTVIEKTWKLDNRERYWIKIFQFNDWNMLNRKLDWNKKGILIPDVTDGKILTTFSNDLIKAKGWKKDDDITLIPTEKGIELVKTSDL